MITESGLGRLICRERKAEEHGTNRDDQIDSDEAPKQQPRPLPDISKIGPAALQPDGKDEQHETGLRDDLDRSLHCEPSCFGNAHYEC